MLDQLINDPLLHAKWLNTLSFLENCGARKIAASEHPTLVKEEMLKHAAEEFRHAHYLKKQIGRIVTIPFPDYSLPYLLGGFKTLHYLDTLDCQTCRLLKKQPHLTLTDQKALAYLLVTYAIECRAAILYPLYDAELKKASSKVTVKSILLEEHEHLREMQEGLALFPDGLFLATAVQLIEETLYSKWVAQLKKEMIGLSFNNRYE